MLHEYCLFSDSIKITQIKEGVNGDPSFYCWHVTEKQPERLQFIIYKSDFTKLVLVCAADTSEPSVNEVTPALCGALWVWALQGPQEGPSCSCRPFCALTPPVEHPSASSWEQLPKWMFGVQAPATEEKRLHFHVTLTKQNKIKEIECENLTLKEY